MGRARWAWVERWSEGLLVNCQANGCIHGRSGKGGDKHGRYRQKDGPGANLLPGVGLCLTPWQQTPLAIGPYSHHPPDSNLRLKRRLRLKLERSPGWQLPLVHPFVPVREAPQDRPESDRLKSRPGGVS